MSENLSVLILIGSRRKPSFTRVLAQEVSIAVARCGAVPRIWDPLVVSLPIADPEYHDAPERNPDPDVRALVDDAQAADGFLFASPIYHNGYSGVLKNALDHLAIAQFRYKPVALVSHGGNRATHAVDQLRIVVRGLLGIALPTQVCSAKDDYVATEDQIILKASDIRTRIERLSVELVAFSSQLKQMRGVPT